MGGWHRILINIVVLYEVLVIPSGKTMNSYLQNHDFVGMLPSPHEAEKRGLGPQDKFPHTCSVKIPVLNIGVSHHKRTSYPKNHKNRHPEFMAIYFLLPCSRRWATRLNEHRNPKGGHVQCICVAVVAASALHWRYGHHIRLRSGATIL